MVDICLITTGANYVETVRLWDAFSGAQVGEPLEGHISGVTSVTFSPDGKIIASSSSDNTVRLWDASSGAQVGEPLEGHSDYVTSVGFSPDGKIIASGSKDKTVISIANSPISLIFVLGLFSSVSSNFQ